jgi:hypothetical protein
MKNVKNKIENRRTKALVLFVLFAAAAGTEQLFCRESAASAPMELLEATGILEGIDDTTEPGVIVLNVDGERAFGSLHEDCVFYDGKQRVLSREVFVRLYTRKVVTAELIQETGQVISCRAGP